MDSNSKVSVAVVRKASERLSLVRAEIGKAFFGHEEVVDALLRALLSNAHVLVEGIPGIAKTLLIRSLARVSGCNASRIQFTVDLLPTDIIGLTTYDPRKGFEVVKGPIFSNFVIADEINRSPPKTQSALIEAMQERQVTIGKTTYKLPDPFFVMANQNPLETEGVYSLPEAQIDRFLFKLIFSYPDRESELRLMEDNATFKSFEDYNLKPILTPREILQLQTITHHIYIDNKVKNYILNLVQRTRDKDFKYAEFIELGGSPRATIGLLIASKAEALLRGRNYVIPDDVRHVIHDVLRHRIIISYRAQAQNIKTDTIIDEIIKEVTPE